MEYGQMKSLAQDAVRQRIAWHNSNVRLFNRGVGDAAWRAGLITKYEELARLAYELDMFDPVIERPQY